LNEEMKSVDGLASQLYPIALLFAANLFYPLLRTFD